MGALAGTFDLIRQRSTESGVSIHIQAASRTSSHSSIPEKTDDGLREELLGISSEEQDACDAR